MRITFKNNSYQNSFAQKGYLVIPKVLCARELDDLLELCKKFEVEMKEPFHTTHFSSDIIYKTTAHLTILKTVFPKISEFLESYIPVFGNFMIKKANSDSFLQLHADWTYIDETKSRSVAVWIPLVDTNLTNGCLGVIEHSHQFMNSIRGPMIQQNNFDKDKIWVKKYGKLLPVRAGDAVIYDHALLHFSLPNKSPKIRPAINLSLVPDSTEIVHYCIPNGAGNIEKYCVLDTSFFLNYENWKRPLMGLPVEVLNKNTIHFIDEKMENYGKKYLNLFERIHSKFKEVLS